MGSAGTFPDEPPLTEGAPPFAVFEGWVNQTLRFGLEALRQRALLRVKFELCGRVAQLVEQCPFKAWVAGSNPAALTISEVVVSFGIRRNAPAPSPCLRVGHAFRTPQVRILPR